MYGADRLLSYSEQLGLLVVVALGVWWILYSVVYKFVTNSDNQKSIWFGGWFLAGVTLVSLAFGAIVTLLGIEIPSSWISGVVVDFILSLLTYFAITKIHKEYETKSKFVLAAGLTVANFIAYVVVLGLVSAVNLGTLTL